MSSSREPPPKRGRGRPRKLAPSLSLTSGTSFISNVTIPSDRVVGPMTLRPNRKFDVSKIYGLDEFRGSESSSHSDSDDIDFVTNETQELKDDSLVFDLQLVLQDEEDSPIKRQTKFCFESKVDSSGSSTDKPCPSGITGKEEDNTICSVCLKKIVATKASYNIFTNVTPNNKSLSDVLKSIVNVDVDQTLSDGNLCKACFDAISKVETLFYDFRRAADSIKDKYILSQRTLSADLTGFDLLDECEEPENCFDLSSCIIVILSDDVSDFKSSLHQNHFGCFIECSFQASFVHSNQCPQKVSNLNSFDLSKEITTTPRLERNRTIREFKNGTPLVYIQKSDLQNLNFRANDSRLLFDKGIFQQKLNPHLLLGSRFVPIILSDKLGVLFKNEKQRVNDVSPTNEASYEWNRFWCIECTFPISFSFFNNLTTHIQNCHGYSEGSKKDASSGFTINDDPRKNDALASLEKPFQCDTCQKCFRHYKNFSVHTDRYHGFKRKCNVKKCEYVASTLHLFVQHYASHSNQSILIPDDFDGKQKLDLKCPLCNQTFQGIWKFFTHSFYHDKEPRFRCPVCTKGAQRVQSFLTHLAKHHNSNPKSSPVCKKDISDGSVRQNCVTSQDETENISDLEKATEHKCIDCGSTYLKQGDLKFHRQLSHTSENERALIFHCLVCSQRFSRLSNARRHFRFEHKDKPFLCAKCSDSFQKESAYHYHLTTGHPEDLIPPEIVEGKFEFPCAFCDKRFSKALLRLRHTRFAHLVNTTEVVDDTITITEDHILESSKDFSTVVKLHSIP